MTQRVLTPLILGAVFMCHAATASKAPVPAPVSTVCIEVESGLVIQEENADLARPPASMVKMVLMLLVSEGLDGSRWTEDTIVPVSGRAQGMGGTQVFLRAGERWPLRQLMRAVAVASANDAAMAVAEGLWGTADAYLEAANGRMAELGMTQSRFHSVHGLPPDDRKTFDQTTARDMATLARECVKHPRILEWTSEREFRFRPGDSTKYNTNKMLWRLENCDGLKTGFIRAAGFCVAATAERGGIRLVTVVMGSPRSGERFTLAENITNEAFQRVKRVRVASAGESLGAPVPLRNAETDELKLAPAEDVWVTVTSEDARKLEVWMEHPDTLAAPIAKGEIVGELQVELRGQVIAHVPLTVPEDVSYRGWRLTLDGGVARWEGLGQASGS